MPLKDSKLSDEWLARAIANNPMMKLENGNVLTGPVRLSFPSLFNPAKQMKADDGSEKTPIFSTMVLFPPGAMAGIQHVLHPELLACVRANFPNNIGQDGNMFGLHPTFRDQGDKQQYAGFMPGNLFATVTSQYKPQVVDAQLNPIVDEARVYAGVWAIVAMNVYAYGKAATGPTKKGVKFGLQSVMIIADDNRLDGGGGSDVKKDFGRVNIDAAYDPSRQFGSGPQVGVKAPPAGFMPAAQPVYAPPPPAYAAPTYDDMI